MLPVLFLSLVAAATAAPPFQAYDHQTWNSTDHDVHFCETQPYRAAAYHCFDGKLCPVIHGVAYEVCGEDCYNPSQYGCKDGSLYQRTSGYIHPTGTAPATIPATTKDPGATFAPTPKPTGYKPTGVGEWSTLVTAVSTGFHFSSGLPFPIPTDLPFKGVDDYDEKSVGGLVWDWVHAIFGGDDES